MPRRSWFPPFMRQPGTASPKRPDEPPVRSRPATAAHAAILDAAEQIFGLQGFEGAGMRMIAEQAEVAQALLHYHFKNKEALYEAVFRRRADVIRTTRQQHLDEAFGGGDPVTLEDVLGVLFMPLEDLLGAKRGDLRFYVQMVADVSTSADERSVAIVKRFYDPSAEQFTAAFQRVLPGLTRERAVWAYLFAIGARMQAHSPSARAARLGVTRNPRWSYALLAPFAAAGIRALAGRPPEQGGQARLESAEGSLTKEAVIYPAGGVDLAENANPMES